MSKSNPDSRGFFKWTVEIEVHQTWVEDGFDLTDRRAHAIMTNALPYAMGHELKAKVLKGPEDAKLAEAMGYASVGAFLAGRKK